LIVSTHCREKIISPILKGRPLEITFIPRCYGVVDNEPPPTWIMASKAPPGWCLVDSLLCLPSSSTTFCVINDQGHIW